MFLPRGEEMRGITCILTASLLICGCSHTKATFEDANDLSSRGSYTASLTKYEQILQKYPATGDRALFEMGVIHAHPKNEQKDHRKSLECFQKLVKDYPGSAYRQDSERMIFYIDSVAMKDETIGTQRTQIETLRQAVENRDNQIVTLQQRVEALEKKVFACTTEKGSVDKVVIEKKERRLKLISKGEVLKTYRIALGGDPNGPKERQGDNKTPEGTYVINSRNKQSRYHLSLHLSYPNESDRKRARELGVSPGGNIMIHGIKNGFSFVGGSHAEVDWTKGCIAVTDEEIEEIAKVAPNGTIVELRP